MVTTECNFWKDLSRAKSGEALAASYLSAIGFNVTDVSNDKEYQVKDIDLLADRQEEHIEVEVKADFMTNKTGNVCVELKSSEVRNGWFNTTESTHLFFVDMVSKDIHCVRTEELRQLFKNNNYRTITQENKGEDGYVKYASIALIPIVDLKKTEHYVFLSHSLVI